MIHGSDHDQITSAISDCLYSGEPISRHDVKSELTYANIHAVINPKISIIPILNEFDDDTKSSVL